MARWLTDGVWLLETGLAAPLAANTYLVDDPDDGTVTLVDTGLYYNVPSLPAEVRAAGYDLAAVDRVLLTHYDLDHVGGLHRLAPFDVPVYVGAADAALLTGAESPPLCHHKGLFHRVARRLHPFPDADLRPVAEGDRVGGFTAYHTPGHNPGHTVYVHADLGAAFLGDLVWADDGGLTTPIAFDSYDMEAVRESVRALAGRVPDFEVAAMGHGRPLTRNGSGALAALAATV
jgi:glyoxylase-like metal-dependent hydrolase (beta-lactamase superfamily II)